MTEKNLVVDGIEINYQGFFDLNGLLKTIDKYSSEKGYSKEEKRRSEKVTPSGKEFSIELRHTKKKSDFEILMIKMRMNITNIKDAEVIREGIKTRLQKGNVNIIFDAWIISEYETRWEQKPWYYFLRSIYERSIKVIFTGKLEGEVSNDCHHIYDNIKAHLNLYKT